jgi:hypothetical protein
MTPQQRRAARDILGPRVDAIEAANGGTWLLNQGRAYLADNQATWAWWGVCAMIVRAEWLFGVRPITGRADLETAALMEEVRVAVGAAVGDPEFANPNSATP